MLNNPHRQPIPRKVRKIETQTNSKRKENQPALLAQKTERSNCQQVHRGSQQGNAKEGHQAVETQRKRGRGHRVHEARSCQPEPSTHGSDQQRLADRAPLLCQRIDAKQHHQQRRDDHRERVGIVHIA